MSRNPADVLREQSQSEAHKRHVEAGAQVVTLKMHDFETMKHELEAAGWKKKSSRIWRAPDCTLHLGQYGAWVKMKEGRFNAEI